MKIGDLIVHFGVTADTFTVRDFAKAIGDIPFSVASAITSLSGLSVGFVELTKNILDMTTNLADFQATTGLSAEELQKWQQVAKQMGIGSETVAGSITSISRSLHDLHFGIANQGFMAALGRLHIKKGDAFSVLQQALANAPSNQGDADALFRQLGVSPDLLRLRGHQGDIAGMSPVLMNKEIEEMEKLQRELSNFSTIMLKQFVPILVQLEPTLQELFQVLTAILKVMGPVAVNALGKTVHVANATRIGGVGGALDYIHTTAHENQRRNAEQARKDIGHVIQHVVQNIHSVADAASVAALAHAHIKREHTKANKYFNNSGY